MLTSIPKEMVALSVLFKVPKLWAGKVKQQETADKETFMKCTYLFLILVLTSWFCTLSYVGRHQLVPV